MMSDDRIRPGPGCRLKGLHDVGRGKGDVFQAAMGHGNDHIVGLFKVGDPVLHAR